MDYDEIAMKVVEIIQRDYHLVKKKMDFTSGDRTAIATKILALVCSYFDIVPAQVVDKSCKGEYVMSRFIFYYLCDKYYPMISNGTMGELTGRKTNTVLYGLRSLKKDLRKDKSVQDLVNEIEGAFMRERNTDEFYKQLNNGNEKEYRQENDSEKGITKNRLEWQQKVNDFRRINDQPDASRKFELPSGFSQPGNPEK